MTRLSPFNTLQSLTFANGKTGHFYSLPQLEKAGIGAISKLPISIRIVLESVLRHCDGEKITESDVRTLANWKANETRTDEIPFVVARVLLQDFTGVPLLVDLAAMRSAVKKLGQNPNLIEPLVPVDLVVDHSVQVDQSGTSDAFRANMDLEFTRNHARYQFLKWGAQAFDTFTIVPPGIGICHQVNLEYLAKSVVEQEGIFYPDSLVGTDSHTTMINGLGIVGWGVGGIEAEAAMLGQPVYFLTPDVVGVNLTGTLNEGVTATDLVLHVTELLRKAKVVGKFVEFFGDGATSLAVTDRATLANMAPEYGATMGFFPIDEKTCEYLRATGRSDEHIDAVRTYFTAQGMFGMPKKGDITYSTTLDIHLKDVVPNVAGPKRPQDRIALTALKSRFEDLFSKPLLENGYNKPASEFGTRVKQGELDLGHGDVLIAAITSCTNTSNPAVMLAAGLLAKKAVEKGLSVSKTVKTSLAPGSRVVSDYLEKTGLQPYLDQLGFNTVGYGCTTCIGNSGPLDPSIEACVTQNDLVAASVLSGNRNFEARVHQNIKANFLMSPPLVVAFAILGTVATDLSRDPLGTDQEGQPVYLRDIWPSQSEVNTLLKTAMNPDLYRARYSGFADQNPLWNDIPSMPGLVYEWDRTSTYIQEPPFFTDFSLTPKKPKTVRGARALAIFGDSVTTDHISPAGAIKAKSPAGLYLQQQDVAIDDFNSYGSRRGNDRVMTRGTFANVRIKNLMLPGTEGGVTCHYPSKQTMSIYDAAMQYATESVPLIIIAGQEYGTGSSRDWAAKGTQLLGVNVVIAESFERIHRSNLVGMGIIPCQFKEGVTAKSLGLTGSETFDLTGLESTIKPLQDATLVIHRDNGTTDRLLVTVRIDTPIEVDYYANGGILPYVLRQLITKAA